ncbi:MMPL family transporter [Paenibacillus sp. TRM 82003]|nr:MMPL family transporter [Paenibacillus sp. TRM 82003]
MERKPKDLLERYGGWVAGKRTRYVTLLVWIAVVAVLNGLLPQANSQENNSLRAVPDDAPSMQAATLASEQYPNEEGLPALVVWHRESGLSDTELQGVQEVARSLTDEPLPDQAMVPPFHLLPLSALQQQVSEDGGTLVLPIFFDEAADAERLKESVAALEGRATEAFGGVNPFDAAVDDAGVLSARVTGPVGILIDATELFSNADFTLLLATVLIVLVLLLLIYRSPILALLPLIGVGFAYGVISPVLGWLGREGWIAFDQQGLSIMTVLLFGAGTDYCLFLISRFRSELKEQGDKLAALRTAVGGTTGAIAMSGFTTVFALLTLLLAQYDTVRSFAIPFALAILIMGIATLTVVPAMLAILGRASFFPFVPRTEEMLRARAERKGRPLPPAPVRPRRTLGDRFGALVVRRPATVTALSLVALLALASVATQVKFTFDTLSSFPEDMPSREGFATIGESFSPGQLAPVEVIVDAGGADAPVKERLEARAEVASVGDPVPGERDPELLSYEVELAVNPYSSEAMDAVPALREAAADALAEAGVSEAGSRVWIAGETAAQYDTRVTTTQDARLIIPAVIALIALLLLAYLRSTVAMIYLIVTVVLSYFSALGLGWLIIHYGLGADAIQGLIPLYAFVFLVALGEDYNIFMVSSIWQKIRRMPLRQAIAEGTSQTGGVITSAGLILAGTFAVLASLPIQILVHFGIITAIGVLLDTFVVRPFLVPAITTLLGRKAFWPGRQAFYEEGTKEAAR